MKVLPALPSYECPRQVIPILLNVPLFVLLVLFAVSCLPLAALQFATVNVTVSDLAVC